MYCTLYSHLVSGGLFYSLQWWKRFFLLSQSDSTMTIWDSTLFPYSLGKLYLPVYLCIHYFFFLRFWCYFIIFLSLFPIVYIYIHLHDDETWFLTFAVSTVAVRLRTHRLVLSVTALIETFLGCLSAYVYVLPLLFFVFFSSLYFILSCLILNLWTITYPIIGNHSLWFDTVSFVFF